MTTILLTILITLTVRRAFWELVKILLRTSQKYHQIYINRIARMLTTERANFRESYGRDADEEILR